MNVDMTVNGYCKSCRPSVERELMEESMLRDYYLMQQYEDDQIRKEFQMIHSNEGWR
jgi:hypothetical protein